MMSRAQKAEPRARPAAEQRDMPQSAKSKFGDGGKTTLIGAGFLVASGIAVITPTISALDIPLAVAAVICFAVATAQMESGGQ